MRTSILALATGLLAVTQARLSISKSNSFENELSKRQGRPTPDNTCGNVAAGANNGYVCDPAVEGGGSCCSQNGYCGSTAAYCGDGCQAQFGNCSATAPTDPPDTEGRCGAEFNAQRCPTGQCCSNAGYCGTGRDFCSDPDCQWRYGTCDSNTTPRGASTVNDRRTLLGSVSYTEDIYDCERDNVVALTFDDGPYAYTNELLDVLKRYGFRATFFITGNNLGKGPVDTTNPYPAVIRRMVSEGHQVASHTWSHYNLSDIGSDMRIQQMTKNERAIANIIGMYPTYMRPPYSECSATSGCQADLRRLGYHRVYFDLDTQDYLNPLPSQVQRSKDIVRQYMADRTVTDYLSIQHDIGEQSVRNLSSYYFDLIRSRGWRGVTVGECLNDSKLNWYRYKGEESISESTTFLGSSRLSNMISSQLSSTYAATSTSSLISSPGSTSRINTASSINQGSRPTTTSAPIPVSSQRTSSPTNNYISSSKISTTTNNAHSPSTTSGQVRSSLTNSSKKATPRPLPTTIVQSSRSSSNIRNPTRVSNKNSCTTAR